MVFAAGDVFYCLFSANFRPKLMWASRCILDCCSHFVWAFTFSVVVCPILFKSCTSFYINES